jgi:hypothetical protein
MITENDVRQAIKISQVLQEYFEKAITHGELRTTDVYEILARKGAVERDRHNGGKFRAFLHHLKKHNQLYLIPQCRAEDNGGDYTNWYFHSAPGKTTKAQNLKPLAEMGKTSTVDENEVKKSVSLFPKRDTSKFTPKETETRENYRRSFEFWTNEEEQLLLEVVKEIKDPFKLSELFQRQPSAIQTRLREKFNIVI